MQLADLAGINALLVRAFSAARREDGYSRPDLPLCKMEFLRFYQQDTPQSCWVVSDGGAIAGAVFGHAWGGIGWIGPLAVSPERQNQGLGQALLRRAVTALRESGCRTIGLETDAGSLHNLAFYSRLGFIPGPVTVDLARGEQDGWAAEPVRAVKCYSQHPALFETLLPSFLLESRIKVDYQHLTRLLQQRQFGESFLELDGARPLFYAALQLVPVSIQEAAGVGRVMALVAQQETDAAALDAFLQTIAAMAECSHIAVRVPAFYPAHLSGLLQRSWRLIHSHLRFYAAGSEPVADAAVHLNKWD